MITPCSHFPRIGDEELAQAVFAEAERMQREKIDAALREWKSRASNCQKGVRLPDGTHCAYRIPNIAYHHWGQRLGYECWDDAGFVFEFLRDNPQCRVQNESISPLSGWTPMSDKAVVYRSTRRGAA